MTSYSITVPDALRYRVVNALIAANFVLEPVETAPCQSPRFMLVGVGDFDEEAAKAAGLTDREANVLRGMSSGMSNAEIGRSLGITEDTVKTHCRSLFRKLGARDRAHAVHIGWQRGLLGGKS